jgi:hypothetical protein
VRPGHDQHAVLRAWVTEVTGNPDAVADLPRIDHRGLALSHRARVAASLWGSTSTGRRVSTSIRIVP